MKYIARLKDLRASDVSLAGEKNAFLGDATTMLHHEGILIPGGFAITAEGYRYFIQENGLQHKIELLLQALKRDTGNIHKTGKAIRKLIMRGTFPDILQEEIITSYRQLGEYVSVAVRSSTANGCHSTPSGKEYADQKGTYLNIYGEQNLLNTCLKCIASFFADHKIHLFENQWFEDKNSFISVGVQPMVRADLACSGVMITVDPKTGFDGVVVIYSAWGLGENIAPGLVTPDKHTVYKPLLTQRDVVPIVGRDMGSKEIKMVNETGGLFSTQNIETSPEERGKFCLSDAEVLLLARWGISLENHYQNPIYVEWAKDGRSDQLYMVQLHQEVLQEEGEDRHIPHEERELTSHLTSL